MSATVQFLKVGAWKVITFATSVLAALIFAMDPTVKVALISCIPPTVSAFIWGWVNHKKLSTVEVNTNSKLSRLLDERNAASSRADRAEGHREGMEYGKRADDEKKTS